MLQSTHETKSSAMQGLWPMHAVLVGRQGEYTHWRRTAHRLWPMTFDLYND